MVGYRLSAYYFFSLKGRVGVKKKAGLDKLEVSHCLVEEVGIHLPSIPASRRKIDGERATPIKSGNE